MSSFLRQTNFSGGELSPRLWGRTDLPVFGKGARTLRNFFVTQEGAAMSRPGTELVAAVKYPNTEVSEWAVRLVPFIYSDTESYCLEFGDQYIRFHSYGSPVIGGLGAPLEVAAPYLQADLARLQWVQSGDVLILVHPDYAPMKLSRTSALVWALSTISVAVPAADPPNGRAIKPLPVPDGTHPVRDWAWAYTIILRRADGSVYENAPSRVLYMEESGGGADEAIPDQVALYQDMPVTLRNTGMGLGAEELVAVRWYRGRGGMWGWIGDVEAQSGTSWEWVDLGQEPDYSRPPPSGRSALETYDASGVLTDTEYPAAVAFFEERLALLGTNERPAFAFLSATGDYYNFDDRKTAPVVLADGALIFELACRKKEVIRSCVEKEKLVIFTNSSVRALSGHQGYPLSADSVDAPVIESIGSSILPPLDVGPAVLYARTKGTGVRAIMPAGTRSGFAGVDISGNSDHLFSQTDYHLVDWCYAEDPYGVVWAVRADGAFLSLQFRPTEQIAAWTRHDTDGLVRNVCSVPEGKEDAIYMVVRRATNFAVPADLMYAQPDTTQQLRIERMTSRRQLGTVQDEVCVDCAIERTPAAPPPATKVVTGLGVHEGKQVYIVSKGNPVYGPLLVTDGAVTLSEVPTANDGANWVAHTGLLFAPEFESLGASGSQVRLLQKTTVSVGIEVDQTKGLFLGQDLDNLREWRQRKASDEYGAIGAATTVAKVAVNGKWDLEARAALRQTQPLPVTLTGITREVDIGG